MAAPPLRVIDFGRVSALHSQTLWHAAARGVSAGEPATLSFAQPDRPYVSIGYHSDLASIDRAECAARSLPVFRRMVGGGPVYLDAGQYFFQIAVPLDGLPASRSAALRQLLLPAVAAFRAVGIDARLDDDGEISVGDRKICGHAAGQIDRAVVVVGNLITAFDHEAATAILATPHPAARRELLRLMQRYVSPTPAEPGPFRAAAAAAYGRALGREPVPGELTPSERGYLAEFDRQFLDPEWLAGTDGPPRDAWRVKVRAGVWVLAARLGPTYLVAGCAAGRVVGATVEDPGLNGAGPALVRRLVGIGVGDAGRALEGFGEVGGRVAAILAAAPGHA